ncbi:hypothetical protein RB24_25010 [Herbaspirillum rubrisubalbicans]|uniref:Uncharacterized protein n=1 Tax=Herbaspirillum rubrisubalbicans TaxID=80842 RepID=A0ABX9BUX3_9BURK|nr:hypothetical protein RB24_25010 [Herbaspirillum rubrisubalbicans]
MFQSKFVRYHILAWHIAPVAYDVPDEIIVDIGPHAIQQVDSAGRHKDSTKIEQQRMLPKGVQNRQCSRDRFKLSELASNQLFGKIAYSRIGEFFFYPRALLVQPR